MTSDNSLISKDPLPAKDAVHPTTPLKSALSRASSNTGSQKLRLSKRVRFAEQIDSLGGEILPPSRQLSPATMIKTNNDRVIDPWKEGGSLHNAYIEYLKKREKMKINEIEKRHTPSPVLKQQQHENPTPTYTHTFVIETKSPDLVVDSITVSTPAHHLPQILRQTNKTQRRPLPTIHSYLKQQLTVSTPPRIIHPKKLTPPSNNFSSVYSAVKRYETALPSPGDISSPRRTPRTDYLLNPTMIHDHDQRKKTNELLSKSLSNGYHQMNHFPERSSFTMYPTKPRLYAQLPRTVYPGPLKASSFMNQLLLPTIFHTSH